MHVRSTVRHSPETGCFVGAPALHLHQPSFSPSQLFVVQHQWKLSSHAVQYSWGELQPLTVLSVQDARQGVELSCAEIKRSGE